jgi:hypothetical protein
MHFLRSFCLLPSTTFDASFPVFLSFGVIIGLDTESIITPKDKNTGNEASKVVEGSKQKDLRKCIKKNTVIDSSSEEELCEEDYMRKDSSEDEEKTNDDNKNKS